MSKGNGKFSQVIKMKSKKETPGTYVFEALDEDASVKSLYIKKAAFKDEPPKEITVTVTE